MKFATIPTWTFDRALQSVAQPHALPFPNPGTTDEIIAAPISYYPIEMDLSKAVEWWWRVRKWRFSAVFDTIGAIEIDLELPVTVDSEKFLCYPNKNGEDGPQGGIWNKFYDASAGPEIRTIDLTLNFLPPDGTKYNEDDNPTGRSYYLPPPSGPIADRRITPVILIYGEVLWEQGGTDIVGGFSSWVTHSFSPGGIPSANATYNNGEIDGEPTEMIFDSGVIVNFDNWTLDPILWWEWADPSGQNPTWNPNTGAKY